MCIVKRNTEMISGKTIRPPMKANIAIPTWPKAWAEGRLSSTLINFRFVDDNSSTFTCNSFFLRSIDSSRLTLVFLHVQIHGTRDVFEEGLLIDIVTESVFHSVVISSVAGSVTLSVDWVGDIGVSGDEF